MWKVALRPRWIAALLLALVVAAAFAALGQWQIQRSVETATVVERDTETIVPLTSLVVPGVPTTEEQNGRRVSVTGALQPGDQIILSTRLNDGEPGYWVVGHLTTVDGAGLAIALGWAADEAAARDAAARLDAELPHDPAEWTGRYFPTEGPQETDFQAGESSAMAPSDLVNRWQEMDAGGVYAGYLVATDAVAGLTDIHSPKPVPELELNWLNVFYAAEWALFAGFAVFLWWRLVKDHWEKEQALAAEAAAASGVASPKAPSPAA